MTISVTNKTRRPSPRIQFEKIKNEILGESYELSLVFIGPTASHRLNKQYRGKDYATDVLSFPISKTSGEIFLDLATTAKQAPKFEMNVKKFTAFLFIHGCLHLKGMAHGRTMEKAEQANLHVASNRRWY